MNVNKVILIGNLTQNVDFRILNTGQPVARLTLATNRIFVDRQGNKKQETDYHTIVAWGKLAELCNKFLQKGRMIYVEGRLHNIAYENQQGQKITKTEIVAEKIKFGPKPKSEEKSDEKDLEELELEEKENFDFESDIDLSDFSF